MTKLNLLVWTSLILLLSCSHLKEESLLELKLSQNSCVESDSISLSVFLNNTIYDGDVKWNQLGIIKTSGSYLFIAPSIFSETTTLNISATVNGQTTTRKLTIIKAASILPTVSFDSTIQPLLTSNCNFSGCHGNGSKAGKVELSNYENVQLTVIPFNANASLLYIALVKTDPLRVMPPAGKLHDYKVEYVKTWIDQGAQNN